jgi:hypothetical protein
MVGAIFTGCAKAVPVEVVMTDNEKDTEVVLNVESTTNENAGFSTKISASADLNGDGKDEEIVLWVRDNPYGEEVVSYLLQIGDEEMEYSGSAIDPLFKVVDILKTDRFREIAVSEQGPSNDDATVFYRYDADTLKTLSVIPGFLGRYPDSDGEGKVKVDGSGTIRTRSRGEILHTWFYDSEYVLNEKDELVVVEKGLYEMNAEVEVIKEIVLKEAKGSNLPGITLNIGEKVTIKETDNKSWCSVTNSEGQTGWFEIRNFDEMVGYEGSYASEFFSGLNYAD